MIRATFTLLVCVLSAASALAMVSTTTDPKAPRWGVVPGVVVVQLKPDVEPAAPRGARSGVVTGLAVLDRVAEDMRATSFDKMFLNCRRPASGSRLSDLSRFYRLEFDVVRDPAHVAAEIQKDPQVQWAEVVTWHAVDQLIPNDPQFISQWHLREGTLPSQDNDVDAPEAWEIQTGDPDVKIAIFDSGVLWSHPDLRDQIWVNPGEDLDGDRVVQDPDDMNGIDDDSNGFIDDLNGWDFVASGSTCLVGEDCTGADNDPRDFNGHGTHVAGIAAAATYNGRDGAGVAGGRYPLQRGCVIMPCRAGWSRSPDSVGLVRTDYVAEGVNYAVANGALVGNLSAGAGTSLPLASALNNAFANGFIFTKSAGNANSNVPDEFDDYFSTIAVVATTKSDTKASYSNYGIWCDISAPGGDLSGPGGIWSTYGAAGVPSFASLSGTSMAAPLVAGCAALLYANNPTFTKAQIEATLFATADSIDHLNLPIYAHFLGAGRVNVGAALASLPQAKFGGQIVLPPNATAAATQGALAPDTAIIGHLPFSVQFTDQSPGPPLSWNWDFGDGGSSTDQSPLHTYTTAGLYEVRLDATHANGTGRKRHQNAVLAHADTNSYDNGKNCPGNSRKAMAVLNLTNTVDLYSLILPLSYQGPGDLFLDSTSFTGTRVSYFELLDRPFNSSSSKFAVVRMKADNGGGSPPLPPGSGPILKLYFKILSNAPVDSLTLNPVDTFTVFNYYYVATAENGVKYWPEWKVGGVNLLPYCRGDFNLSGAITSSDIILEVNYVFKSGPPSTDAWTMDVDLSGAPTSSDIIFMVNHVFKGGSAPQ